MTEEFLDIEMAIDTFRHKRNKDREYIFKEINKKNPFILQNLNYTVHLLVINKGNLKFTDNVLYFK